MLARRQKALAVGLALFLLFILMMSVALHPMFGYPRPINYLRWMISSRFYKAEVLAQPSSANKEFKHIEWDGWGWAGMDTTVYLVFDPSDSLSAAANSHQPGQYDGIPCEVYLVRRLETNWYTVWFYTDEWWSKSGARKCNGSG